MNYRTFTANLSRLDDYRKSLDSIKEELDLILYEMTGVKGISYDKLPSSYNPSLTALKSLEMVEKYNEKQQEFDFTLMAIQQVEIVLARMPSDLAEMLKEVFVKGMTYKAVGMKYGYSDHGMWQMLKRETEKYL